jgi:hypothetical protein
MFLLAFQVFFVKKHLSPLVIVLEFSVVLFYSLWTFTRHCTKQIVITKKYIKFDDYVNIRPWHAGNSVNYFWLKVNYCVTDVCDISFKQNAFEKIFNVGHLSFSGHATFEAKRDVDKIKPPDAFFMYGIKNFSQFKETFPFKN